MTTISSRIDRLEQIKDIRIRRRSIWEYSDAELRAVLTEAGVDPDDDAQLEAAARWRN